MKRGPGPVAHLALGKYARVVPDRGLDPPEALSIVRQPLGYKTAFSAAELAAEKFSSCSLWYSRHFCASQISR